MNRRSRANIFDSPVLTGAVVVLVMVIGLYISYGADKGLPFVPTFQFKVAVPDAQKLVVGDAVHVGGARVGQVIEEKAIPGNPPYTQLTLAVSSGEKVPTDSQVEIRPLSILGAKYVSLSLGHAKQLVPPGGILPISQAHRTVELNDAFRVFDPQTTRAIRSAVNGLGDALAARGGDVNLAIGSAASLLGPLERVTRNLTSPRTDLPGFISGVDSLTAALAPVAGELGAGTASAAVTFQALAAADREFGRAVDQLPQTEEIGTAALGRLAPVLADAAAIARAIRPGTHLLPSAARNLANTLEAGVPPLRRGRVLAGLMIQLDGALNALTAKSNPAFTNSLIELEAATQALQSNLNTLAPAQITCNVLGIFFRNVNSVIGLGAPGSWLSVMPLLGSPQGATAAKPSSNLHVNPYPQENATRCEAGNEPYRIPQTIGPPAISPGTTVDQTSQPPGVAALAAGAGLLAPTPGARP